jgi:ABC-2 type transport system ATP-binding protein
MGTNPVIVTNSLARRFGDTIAVNNLNLEVNHREIFGFLGHNGAGKTTTVRLLNGVLTPTQGTVRVLGLSPDTDGPALRCRTGVLTETPSLDERLTGRENLHIYADLFGVPQSEVLSRVNELLAIFELSDHADQKAGSYSRGMKQRLAIARALLHRPEILFLDEPTAGLDPVSTHQVQGLITHLSRQEGRTVFLCTHNLAEAQKLCDRVAVLEHGRLLALGTPAELARQVVHSQRLEIEVSPQDLPQALGVLGARPGLKASSQGNGTLVVQGAQREAVPDLVAALVAARVRIYRVASQEPTLEDVYFALYGKGEVS